MIKPMSFLNKYFYFCMSLLIAAIVAYGFSHTIDRHLIHPDLHPPSILYVHVAIFSGWVLFFILQTTLVRTHTVRLHRMLGWFGVVLGTSIPVLGSSTAIIMARFHILHFHSTDEASGLMVSFFDMTAFSIPFALAIYWRKKPELHRRLILIATCALTSAAFARFPAYLIPRGYGLFYAGVDLLILLGVARDLIVSRRVHRVYLYTLPCFVLGQLIVLFTSDWPYWTRIGEAILR